MTDEIISYLKELAGALWTPDKLLTAAKLVAVLGVAFLALRLSRRMRFRRLDPQQAMLGKRALSFLIVGLAGFSVLNVLGLGLGPLLGAAGVLTIALGFASQTSVSNVISGIFLIGERPFVVGDFIDVGGTMGAVLSIDLMSVQLRTVDNLMVRIPNETMLKANVVNFTRFPVRRVACLVTLAYDQPLAPAKEILLDVADKLPELLIEPAPQLRVLGPKASGVDVELGVWVQTVDFIEARTAFYTAVVDALREGGVQMATTATRLSGGPASAPVPVRVHDEGTA